MWKVKSKTVYLYNLIDRRQQKAECNIRVYYRPFYAMYTSCCCSMILQGYRKQGVKKGCDMLYKGYLWEENGLLTIWLFDDGDGCIILNPGLRLLLAPIRLLLFKGWLELVAGLEPIGGPLASALKFLGSHKKSLINFHTVLGSSKTRCLSLILFTVVEHWVLVLSLISYIKSTMNYRCKS